MVSPEAAEALRCRQILVELLEPVAHNAEELAGRLIARFGSLAEALAANRKDQAEVLGGAAAAARHLGAIRDAMLHALRAKALAEPPLNDWQALLDYLFLDMAHQKRERLRILFLNSANHLVHEEVGVEGCISETPIYPREIMRSALEHGATALILVHNHPSGDPRPSPADVDATRCVVRAGNPLGIAVHDHIIVGRSGWTSLRSLGLLELIESER